MQLDGMHAASSSKLIRRPAMHCASDCTTSQACGFCPMPIYKPQDHQTWLVWSSDEVLDSQAIPGRDRIYPGVGELVSWAHDEEAGTVLQCNKVRSNTDAASSAWQSTWAAVQLHPFTGSMCVCTEDVPAPLFRICATAVHDPGKSSCCDDAFYCWQSRLLV